MDFKTGSGDLTADRRFEMARHFAERGDHEAAADLMGQALKIVPGWAAGWFQRGQALAKAGMKDEAADAFRCCLALDPADALGAALDLRLLEPVGEHGGEDVMPDAYIRALFDQYAPRFDAALEGQLGYRAPLLVRRMVDRLRPAMPDAVLDLGCGTGLSGAAMRGRAARMDGVDLSPGMIAEARRKALYDTLTVADIRAFLAGCLNTYDLVLAVDVLIYLGRLDDIFSLARRVLRRDGLFCFTVQALDGTGYALGADHRYSYSEAYLREAAGGWEIAALEPCVLRQDAGRDVPGFVCALR